ncbi:CoA-binding protein [Thermodesulfobacteriota bacterium]
MKDKQTSITNIVDLHRLFHPRSIAIVGASAQSAIGRWTFLSSMIKGGYQGSIYPVNPRYSEIEGIKAYPTVEDIAEDVDMAIIMLPAEKTPEIIDQCVRKKVLFVVLFSAGFSEIGNKELEAKLIEKVRNGPTRIVGPNCIGAHCPSSGVVYSEVFTTSGAGNVGYISQSGGHANMFTIMGTSRGLAFNKVLSVGNQADIAHQDVIAYFGRDPEIEVITAYIEDIKRGSNFFETIKGIPLKKPVILWKGGSTEDGARAASSHTGALASPVSLFNASMKQHGILLVDTMEEMADLALVCNTLDPPRGNRVGIVVAGGGGSVEATDGVAREGLHVPVLEQKTQDRIGKLIPKENTSPKNPVDLGMFGAKLDAYFEAIMATAEDPNVDALIVSQMVESFHRIEWFDSDSLLNLILKARDSIDKPLICIVPRIFERDPEIETERIKFIEKLLEGGVVSFPNISRGAKALYRLTEYGKIKKRR